MATRRRTNSSAKAATPVAAGKADSKTKKTSECTSVAAADSGALAEIAKERARLLNEVRYAERLCHRTARLYRRIASILAWVTLIGGSSAFLALKHETAGWLVATAGIIWAALHALDQVMKPAAKSALNLHDSKRYSRLMTQHRKSLPTTIQRELDKLRENDGLEVESMRDIAWNDVMVESNNLAMVVPLSRWQRLLRWFS